MQDIFGSVRRSLVFRGSTTDDGGRFGVGGFVEKIGSSIRKSRIGLFQKFPSPALPPIPKIDAPAIRWRKGELIGSGAFGRVYMGMNLDSGELIAVKQVSIAASSASKEKTQAHIRELEEEVRLLKNLSHPNIVRYLGTAREDESLNILLEFVPGGSISSLLGKFGSFPEAVIRMYTKQLLLGLAYLHENGIMHRDIKGANILVDNKGCIKLADFGASKKVVELVTMTGAKSMKGTPYWMAPEVILQTGHSFSADIWSVGCTVIEMATGKPPWSQQYQEVAALFHIGTTKSHPPIPEHLSAEAKDFLLKCLQKEPNLRTSASDLLQHPFVTTEYQELNSVLHTSIMENSRNMLARSQTLKNSTNPVSIIRTTCGGLKDVCSNSSVRCSTVYPEKFSAMGTAWKASICDDDMCQIDDDLVVGMSTNLDPPVLSGSFNKSYNPMSEPTDDWPCKFDKSPELERSKSNLHSSQTVYKSSADNVGVSGEENDFTFPCGTIAADDEEEVTESKIRAFLDEKAFDLKKLQTPLYEEFYNSMNPACPPSGVGNGNGEIFSNIINLPPKSKAYKKTPSRRLSAAVNAARVASLGRRPEHVSNIGIVCGQTSHGTSSPQLIEWNGALDSQREASNLSASFSERQRKWKEELDEELARKRAMMREACGGNMQSRKTGLQFERENS